MISLKRKALVAAAALTVSALALTGCGASPLAPAQDARTAQALEARAADGGTITHPAFVCARAAANLRSPRNAIAPRSALDRGATAETMTSPPRTTSPPMCSARAATVRDDRVWKNLGSGMARLRIAAGPEPACG